MSETNEPTVRNGQDEQNGKTGNGCMSKPISWLRPDIDLGSRRCVMRIASERLSIVRYVFLVQIEDGIATAEQRASLEYADAVLIGWPEEDAQGTTEYAILVGVLVVIAILAIVAFKGKVQELWTAIQDGMAKL